MEKLVPGKFEVHEPQYERREWCHHLNEAFRNKKRIYDEGVLEEVRKAPFPIILDYNNVLVNNKRPFRINPDAKTILQSLVDIGDVFIVTSALDWETVALFLEQIDPHFRDKTVLLVADNYTNSDSFRLLQDPMTTLSSALNDYLEMVDKEGLHERLGLLKETDFKLRGGNTKNISLLRKMDLARSPAEKGVAAYFMKRWCLPVIDDLRLSTVRGLAPLWVPAWPSEEDNYDPHAPGRMTLDEAITRVKAIRESVKDLIPSPL